MSHNEKTFIKIAVLTLGVLAFQACGKGFQASNTSLSSTSSVLDGGCIPGSGNGFCITPPVNPGTSPDLGGLALSLGQILGLAVSNFPSISTLAACETVGPCTGTTSSSQTITANCSVSGQTLTGQTVVGFNAPQCSPLSASAMTIAPTLNGSASGQTFAISSTNSTDYTGTSSGGGLQVNYAILSASGTISDLGVHITGSGTHSIDVSSHSLTPSNATVNVLNAKITVNGGQLVLADNNGHYSATLTPNNLVFGTGCACPTSGSISGPLSGTSSGTVSMTFNATCGSVTISAPSYGYNNVTQTVSGCNPL